MDQAGPDGALAGGAPAPAPAADAGAPAPSPAPAVSAPSGATAPAGSLLARGAGSGDGGQSPAAAPAADAAAIPDKYLVKREDGTTDWEASALKQAQGYNALATKLGAGDVAPKTPEDYAPPLPDSISLDALKTDPLYQGFLKGAHAKGMTNAQVGYVLEAFAQRESMKTSPEVAEAELRKVWQTDEQMQAGLAGAYRVVKAYAGGDEQLAKLEAKFGSDPDFLQFMARIAPELKEDRPPGGFSSGERDTLQSLMAHPAYFDAKHPEHAIVVAKTRQLYAKAHG
jgi:hypothetical protein